MDTLTNIARDLLGPIVSSLFDPNPIDFKIEDEKGVIPVRRACSSAAAELAVLKHPINRNAFLCGCLDVADGEPVEHLIVGFGERRGSTTRVSGIAHAVGTATQVAIPVYLARRIDEWITRAHRTEVLIFHNHPRNDLNALLDNLPLASHPDRSALLHYHLNPLLAVKGALGGSRVRFYVGENGFVRQFHTPNIDALISDR
jgi:hypothetical protein